MIYCSEEDFVIQVFESQGQEGSNPIQEISARGAYSVNFWIEDGLLKFEFSEFTLVTGPINFIDIGNVVFEVISNSNMSAGSVNLADGNVGTFIYYFTVDCSLFREQGYPPLQLEIQLGGKMSANEFISGKYFSLRLLGQITLDSSVPIFGGYKLKIVPRCPGCREYETPPTPPPAPNPDNCPKFPFTNTKEINKQKYTEEVKCESEGDDAGVTIGPDLGPKVPVETQPTRPVDVGSGPSAGARAWDGCGNYNIFGLGKFYFGLVFIWIPSFPDGQSLKDFHMIQMTKVDHKVYINGEGPTDGNAKQDWHVDGPKDGPRPGDPPNKPSNDPTHDDQQPRGNGATNIDIPGVPVPNIQGSKTVRHVITMWLNVYLVCTKNGNNTTYGHYSYQWTWDYTYYASPPSGQEPTGGVTAKSPQNPSWNKWDGNSSDDNAFRNAMAPYPGRFHPK